MQAAVRLIDHEGLDALTTRRLATELGMHQPNLYRRISDRNHLLDLVTHAIMDEVGLPDTDTAEWREWLTDCGVRIWRTWGRHPQAAPLMFHGGTSPAVLRLFDKIFGTVLNSGLPQERVPGACQAYLGYVFGTTMLEAIGRSSASASRAVADEELGDYSRVLEARTILRALKADHSAEHVFIDGLKQVLDGIEIARVPRTR